MGKRYFTYIQLLTALTLLVPGLSHAEDIFLDCSNPNTRSDKCTALYAEQAFLPVANEYQVVNPNDPNYRIVEPNNIDMNAPDLPINATPGQDFIVPGLGYEVPTRQVVMRDTAAPLAVSQPADDLEKLGSEYSVYKTPNGSLIIEHDA